MIRRIMQVEVIPTDFDDDAGWVVIRNPKTGKAVYDEFHDAGLREWTET